MEPQRGKKLKYKRAIAITSYPSPSAKGEQRGAGVAARSGLTLDLALPSLAAYRGWKWRCGDAGGGGGGVGRRVFSSTRVQPSST